MLLVSGTAVTEDHKPGSLEQQKGTASQLWRPVCLQAAILRKLRGTVRSLPFPAPGSWPATLSAPGLTAASLLSQPVVTRPSALHVRGAVDACHCMWGHPNLGRCHLQILPEYICTDPESREILLRKVHVDLPLGGCDPTCHKHRGPSAQLRTSGGPCPGGCYPGPGGGGCGPRSWELSSGQPGPWAGWAGEQKGDTCCGPEGLGSLRQVSRRPGAHAACRVPDSDVGIRPPLFSPLCVLNKRMRERVDESQKIGGNRQAQQPRNAGCLQQEVLSSGPEDARLFGKTEGLCGEQGPSPPSYN
ncbi:uncharacterized protein LOC133065241 [Dama dama]|uniref:uncharacterized protein LOC133065241 n=1 Tax=Dama dama TaxID=30532 RepID=UPI002A36E8DA|nr:uncharacterized protein LOC133065241 [Dama dama]